MCVCVEMRIFFLCAFVAVGTVPLVNRIQDQYSVTWNALKDFSDGLAVIQSERMMWFAKKKVIEPMEFAYMSSAGIALSPWVIDFSNLANAMEHLEGSLALVVADSPTSTAAVLAECGVVIERVLFVLTNMHTVIPNDEANSDPIMARLKTTKFANKLSSLTSIAEEAIYQWRLLQVELSNTRLKFCNEFNMDIHFDGLSGQITVVQIA